MYLSRQGHVGLQVLCLGTGDAVAVCTELSRVSLTQKHSLISQGVIRKIRKVRAEGTRVLKAISDACPNSLPCAGVVLDHLKCLLMPEMGRAPSYHSPPTVLFLFTLHSFRASFSEVMCEGEVHVGWSSSTALQPKPLTGWL